MHAIRCPRTNSRMPRLFLLLKREINHIKGEVHSIIFRNQKYFAYTWVEIYFESAIISNHKPDRQLAISLCIGDLKKT